MFIPRCDISSLQINFMINIFQNVILPLYCRMPVVGYRNREKKSALNKIQNV